MTSRCACETFRAAWLTDVCSRSLFLRRRALNIASATVKVTDAPASTFTRAATRRSRPTWFSEARRSQLRQLQSRRSPRGSFVGKAISDDQKLLHGCLGPAYSPPI